MNISFCALYLALCILIIPSRGQTSETWSWGKDESNNKPTEIKRPISTKERIVPRSATPNFSQTTVESSNDFSKTSSVPGTKGVPPALPEGRTFKFWKKLGCRFGLGCDDLHQQQHQHQPGIVPVPIISLPPQVIPFPGAGYPPIGPPPGPYPPYPAHGYGPVASPSVYPQPVPQKIGYPPIAQPSSIYPQQIPQKIGYPPIAQPSSIYTQQIPQKIGYPPIQKPIVTEHHHTHTHVHEGLDQSAESPYKYTGYPPKPGFAPPIINNGYPSKTGFAPTVINSGSSHLDDSHESFGHGSPAVGVQSSGYGSFIPPHSAFSMQYRPIGAFPSGYGTLPIAGSGSQFLGSHMLGYGSSPILNAGLHTKPLKFYSGLESSSLVGHDPYKKSPQPSIYIPIHGNSIMHSGSYNKPVESYSKPISAQYIPNHGNSIMHSSSYIKPIESYSKPIMFHSGYGSSQAPIYSSNYGSGTAPISGYTPHKKPVDSHESGFENSIESVAEQSINIRPVGSHSSGYISNTLPSTEYSRPATAGSHSSSGYGTSSLPLAGYSGSHNKPIVSPSYGHITNISPIAGSGHTIGNKNDYGIKPIAAYPEAGSSTIYRPAKSFYPEECQCVQPQHCSPYDTIRNNVGKDIAHLVNPRNEAVSILSNATNYKAPLRRSKRDELITNRQPVAATKGRALGGYTPGLSGCGPNYVCCRISVQEPKQLDGVCGKSLKSSIHGRIANTEYNRGATQFGEFPWQGAILKDKNYESAFVCGATLISPQHVLTAAHCIVDEPYRHLKVRLGDWDVNSVSEFYKHIELPVETAIIHPKFYAGNLNNDIAVITMHGYVDFNAHPHISPICLPNQYADFTHQHCYVSGWGKNAFGYSGEFQQILKKVDLPVVDRKSCQYALQEAKLGRDYHLPEGFICAGGEEGKDTCKGDGGGPLVCPTKYNTFELAGIVSWGIECGLRGVPGVYVNIPYYVDWIKSIVHY